MPAAVRGESRTRARPQPKATARAPRPRAVKPKAAGFSNGKLRAARGVGLSPKHALAAASAVIALAVGVTLVTGHRGENLAAGATASAQHATGAMGFKLAALHVEGASAVARADIVQASGLYKDQPLLGMDLEALRKRVETVGWVKEARVVRLLPDTLLIDVVERPQLAVWQNGGRLLVIDERGEIIPEADARRFPTLPLIVGTGANRHAPEILAAVKQRPQLMQRLEAIVRVDGRRWDLRMKDGSLVQLPASDEERALIQLEQLDQRTRILQLGFERIDLRNPDMVAVRLRDAAMPGQLAAGGA